MSAGRFITVEGGEGVGKTTVCRHIVDLLKKHKIEVITTREPGGSEGADQIRQLLVTGPEDRWDALSETLLLLASRRDHVMRIIRPALKSGIWVVSDRFSDSTLAYQGFGHGLDIELLRHLSETVTDGLRPDLTILLDAPSKIGLKRAFRRGGIEMRYEMLQTEFHERARKGFLKIAEEQPERCKMINAARPVKKVEADVASILMERFLEWIKCS